MQVTFPNVAGATRFKAMDKNKTYETVRPKCKKAKNNWEHHYICYKIGPPELGSDIKEEGWPHMVKQY